MGRVFFSASIGEASYTSQRCCWYLLYYFPVRSCTEKTPGQMIPARLRVELRAPVKGKTIHPTRFVHHQVRS